MANNDGIPIMVREPSGGAAGRPVALWIPWLTGAKEAVAPTLERLAERGFVAVSVDPWQHGSRARETKEQMMSRVFSAFRFHFWSILGHTVLDALRVLDRCVSELSTSQRVVAGGVSMGGDVALALAGVEPRISRVATIASTPDWTRPGMTWLEQPDRLVDQGTADAQARWFYEAFDPLRNVSRYLQRPALQLISGANDRHVPGEASVRFRDAVVAQQPGRADSIELVTLEGLDHLGTARSTDAEHRAIEFLSRGAT